MTATQQCFPVVLFEMLSKDVLHCESGSNSLSVTISQQPLSIAICCAVKLSYILSLWMEYLNVSVTTLVKATKQCFPEVHFFNQPSQGRSTL